MDRYFVDERCGCIAVRDRRNTDPDYPGLHEYTDGVVGFWMATERTLKKCPLCNHTQDLGFNVDPYMQMAAHDLARKLNEGAQRQGL